MITVATFADADPKKAGVIFFVEDEDAYYGSEAYPTAGNVAALTARDVGEDDILETAFGVTIGWGGAAEIPITPTTGWNLYFRITDYTFRYITSAGTINTPTAGPGLLRLADGTTPALAYALFAGGIASSFDSVPWGDDVNNIRDLGASYTSEAEVLAFLADGSAEANSVAEALAADDQMVLYYDTGGTALKIITAYTAPVTAGEAYRLESIGGGAFTEGPATNTFTGGTVAVAEAARDTYAVANAAWLAEYDADSCVVHHPYGRHSK